MTTRHDLGDRRIIIPDTMQRIYDDYGYAPAVVLPHLIYCAGQVGRDADLNVILDAEAQFRACWANLQTVLEAAGSSLDGVVDLVSYHVNMPENFKVFKTVKNEVFPRGKACWTAIGVHSLSRPGLLVELKAVAVPQP